MKRILVLLLAVVLVACDIEQSAYHIDRGSQMASRGKYEEAMAEYRRARELNPKWAAPSVELGNVLRHLGKFEEAATEYRQALAVEATNAEAKAGLGECLKAIELQKGTPK